MGCSRNNACAFLQRVQLVNQTTNESEVTKANTTEREKIKELEPLIKYMKNKANYEEEEKNCKQQHDLDNKVFN